jgi:hypothetical protein
MPSIADAMSRKNSEATARSARCCASTVVAVEVPRAASPGGAASADAVRGDATLGELASADTARGDATLGELASADTVRDGATSAWGPARGLPAAVKSLV